MAVFSDVLVELAVELYDDRDQAHVKIDSYAGTCLPSPLLAPLLLDWLAYEAMLIQMERFVVLSVDVFDSDACCVDGSSKEIGVKCLCST